MEKCHVSACAFSPFAMDEVVPRKLVLARNVDSKHFHFYDDFVSGRIGGGKKNRHFHKKKTQSKGV